MIWVNGIPITDLMNKEENILEKTAFYNFADEHGIKYLEHEELSKHTSFKIGGPAEIFAKPENNEQVSAIIKYCKENDIPCLNLFDNFGFCWQEHTSDGCHPNEAGHILIAKAITEKLKELKLPF